MNSSIVAHRWANKDFGKNGTLTASRSCHAEGRNYFSYSTVFGQWLDLSKNVVAIFDGSTSTTSSKYKLHKGDFPDDVHVFPLNFDGGHFGWSSCNLICAYRFNDEDFTFEHRMRMIDHYVECIYDQLAAINGGKKKGLENVDFSSWNYVVELCGLYKDTSIAKYIKWLSAGAWKSNNDAVARKKKLVKLLKDGEFNVKTLVDSLFGEGTYDTYWNYCARFRKAAENRAKVEALCERLGIASPYESYWRSGRMNSELTADQIRKLTAKERLDLHFASLMCEEQRNAESAAKEKFEHNRRNAYKWIVGSEPERDNAWSSYYKSCTSVRNMYNGVVYDVTSDTSMPSFFGWRIDFNYDSFRESEDKGQWIAEFYAKCATYSARHDAHNILKRIGAPTREKKRSYDNNQYYDCEFLRQNTTSEEYALCLEYINDFDENKHREELEKRAAAIERARREEERRKEREYMESVKKEQIAACVQEGADGCRNLWRNHLTGSFEAERYFENVAHGDFFMGGNVLLRLNLNKDRVETSKNIRMPIEVAKKFFCIIKKWHENPSSFKPIEIDAKGSGRYTISSYKKDILTAGCHKIAYAEMERMYNDILKLEAAA